MNFVAPDSCLQDYKKRRRAVSQASDRTNAKEFRRWIDRNSVNGDDDKA
jgi:hypothetical protein